MSGLFGDPKRTGLLNALLQPVRRKIFVSYHHGKDQGYYDAFSRIFHDQYEAVYDNSLERRIDSDDVHYVMQRIRDNHITNTSCTVLLIGAASHDRKYVDWEIKATLDKEHGLVGVILPTHQRSFDGKVIVPDRFHDNVTTGYAGWLYWDGLNIQSLTQYVNAAVVAPKNLINNSRAMRQRDG